MSHNPNTVKSQAELNPCNDGKRSSEVLLSTIEELEKTKKENEILKDIIDEQNKSIREAERFYKIMLSFAIIGLLMELVR